MNQDTLISCENLSLGYEGRAVVEEVNLKVNAGDYVSVLGENGSGKTTLLRSILGLMKPMSGTIKYAGGLDKREIGYLPQQTQAQRDFPASVREVVRSGCLNSLGPRPFYTKAQRALADYNMARLDIQGLAGRSYRTLSGGQQQRVLLARALCAARKMLLLDEPTAGLDPHISRELYDLIAALNKEGLAILMISHDVHQAAMDADKVLHLARKPLFWGTAGDYRASEIGKVYLSQEAET